MKWFRMDSDTPNHPTSRRVIRKQGNAGFGALVRLWCFAAQYGKGDPGRCIDSDGDAIPEEDLRDACGLDEMEFSELIEVLIGAKCIDEKAWTELGELSFPGMTTRADEYTKKVRRNEGRRPVGRPRKEDQSKLVDIVRTTSGQTLPRVQDKRVQDITEEGMTLLEVFRKGNTKIKSSDLPPDIREKVRTEDFGVRLAAEWNKVTSKPIPQCRGLSKNRRRLVNRLMTMFTVETVIEAFRKMDASKFCRGENDRGWVATFDWALLPDSILKAGEGKYDDRAKPVKAGQTRSTSGKYDKVERK